jgi:acetyl/propionyl-CoA carboxylase alpha subunit
VSPETSTGPLRPLRTLLIANRGEIARRIIRTAHDMGIACVAVHADPDADSPHVREADLAVRLPGASPADTYLRTDLLLDAAARTGADAVHPGYGFLSESGDAARAVTGAGLVWVGPPADAIDAMGSKVAAKELMRAAGVPTLPSIVVDADGALPDPARVEELGWPLLVKASAGGGGRGMRIVGGPDGLADALDGARREAASAFGDGTVFLERYVTDPRHIEVQVLGDTHGGMVALFERECSIQRRHQKIIEEAPSPAVGPDLRAHLMEVSIAAARAVGYVNAGTVEYVVDSDGAPFFLEMNTRLQVEHPVTEAVTGLDLVRLQLLVAAGAALPAEVHGAVARGPVGHAVEARLYAEDPAAGWRPSTGTLQRFEVPVGDGVRLDAGVASGSVVGPHYDPMLAKVIAAAPTRDEAVARLSGALAAARLHGVTTNRDLLVRVLRHPAFGGGATDTGFLDRHGLADLAAPLADPGAVRRQAVALALADQADRRRRATVQPAVPSGFRNSPSALQETTYATGDGDVTVGYRFDRTGHRLERLEVDGAPVDLEAVTIGPDAVVLAEEGVARRYRVERGGDTGFVDGPDGSTTLVARDRFPIPGGRLRPGSSVAPMPGSVVRVAVSGGQPVVAGETLVVLEAMKMEHTVAAAGSGTVAAVHVAVGDQVETGQLLAVVEVAAGDGEEGPGGGTDPDTR